MLTYNFDLSNIGNAAALGNFNVKAWISADNTISNDDIQNGNVTTGNYGPGLTVSDIPGASAIPAGLADGSYYLILKVDADNDIVESNEGNNEASTTFTVSGNGPANCSGDIVLTSQAEVDAFGPCAIYNGDISVDGNDITNIQSFAGLTSINGDLILDGTNNLSDLNGLEQLGTVTGVLNIDDEFNGALSNISALSNLKTVGNGLSITDLPISNLSGLDNLESVGAIFFRDLDQITNLDELGNLTHVGGTIWISLCEDLEDISGLSNVTQAEGIDLRRMDKIKDISALRNISGQLEDRLNIEGLGISNLNGLQNITGVNGRASFWLNQQLQNVDALSNLTSAGEFLLSNNNSLTDCCGAYPLLNNNGVAGLIQILGNPGCASEQDILNNCVPSGDIDLSLTMTTSKSNPLIYTSVAITITVNNSGQQTATGVWAVFQKPDGVVYEGGNEWSATQGTFYPFGNQWWDIGSLAPGESASLTVNYFLLTSNTLTPWAEISDANEQDADSTPANGVCCTPSEDDEATILINDFTGGGNSNNLTAKGIIGRPIQLQSINPNPVYFGETTVRIQSKLEGTFDLEVYDLFGRKAISQKITLKKGRNKIPMDIYQLESGTYYLSMPGHNWRNMPLRFVVARW